MNKGRLIVFEGIEGCGKTTQSRILTERLKAEGLTAVWTCEPGGCRLGEQIRSIIKDKYSVCPLSELMLLEAARAQHVRELIEPALNKGVTVVCDRFIGSTLAYQSALGIDIALIEELNSIALGGIAPDITFLLDADAHLSFCRVLQRGCPDRIEAKGQACFEAVRSNYLYLYFAILRID